MASPVQMETDVVIAGSGPGGCAVARELALAGRSVVLIEKGSPSRRFLGSPLGIALRLEKDGPLSLRKTVEGETLVLARGVGGGTVLYSGSAFLPDHDYWQRHGINLDPALVEEAEKECWVSQPPERFIGPGARRVWDAAREVGIPFDRLGRHVDFTRCREGCARCTFGCPIGAKWTGGVYVDEALARGAQLLTRVQVEEILVEDGVATGVRARGRRGRRYEIRARAVVCSAGGIHTAELLRRAGLREAGTWFTGDPTIFTFGFVRRGPGNGREHSMTVGYHDAQSGLCYASMASPSGAWHVQLLQDRGLRALRRLHRFGRVLSVFAKVSDEGQGEITDQGQVHKTFTPRDQERFRFGQEQCQKILIQAGCEPSGILRSSFTLGHPSGTVRVGQLLDTDLQTPIDHLYCCDTSVFPEAPGQPPALTVAVLGKRLARHLLTAGL